MDWFQSIDWLQLLKCFVVGGFICVIGQILIDKTKLKQKKVGDIEYCYLQCARCKAVYTISATDSALRQDIKRFGEMMAKAEGRRPTEKETQEAQELLKANMARNREIKAQYPLEIK